MTSADDNIGNVPKTPEELATEDGRCFVEKLKEPKNWSTFPLLNYTPLHLMKDFSIVRFRGMIQDMKDPEMYLERYEVKARDGTTRLQEGKYRDCMVVNSDEEVNYYSKANVIEQRRTLFMVSIPGINNWAREYEEKCNARNIQITEAKANDDDMRKRAAASEENDSDSMELELESPASPDAAVCSEPKKRKQSKKSKDADEIKASYILGPEYHLNSPIPDRPSKACMIKIYENFESYALNTVIEVIGFLSVNPALSVINNDVDMGDVYDNPLEMHAQNPPPSLIPRLHAIAIHELAHINPLIDMRFQPSLGVPLPARDLDMLAVYKDLRILLKLCLLDDDLAADYMISHLVSTVYNRTEMYSVGKFCLNLCNLPPKNIWDYTKKLYEILDLLLPASHYLPLNLDNMNIGTFIPKKDYETQKLVSGLLQLGRHTHLVLDETHMEPGTLDANGVSNIQNLAQLINEQKIKCNFHYYNIDYNVDIPVLILSEGSSVLPKDFILPLSVDNNCVSYFMENFKAALCYLQAPERLFRMRQYLTVAKTTDSFLMNKEVIQMIQNEFVEMRTKNQNWTTDDLHALLVLSRLQGVARGKKELDKESWELAKTMETKRRERIQKLPRSTSQFAK